VGNNRILIYHSVPSATGALPDLVLGNPDFDSNEQECNATDFQQAFDFFMVDGKLLAADTWRNRVLIWNSIPTSNGAPADLVLGQVDFESCDDNRGGSVNAGTLAAPTGIWSDGQRVIVADMDNYRILIWNTFPTVNGQAADGVVGQNDFNSRVAPTGTSAISFQDQLKVYSNGVQIFVTETNSHRVLIWNSIPTAAGTPADAVLGQEDFISATEGTSQTKMRYPDGLFLYGDKLFVADHTGNRILVFQGQIHEE
jgi:hypothetical protein